jgi:hypothetical protein
MRDWSLFLTMAEAKYRWSSETCPGWGPRVTFLHSENGGCLVDTGQPVEELESEIRSLNQRIGRIRNTRSIIAVVGILAVAILYWDLSEGKRRLSEARADAHAVRGEGEDAYSIGAIREWYLRHDSIIAAIELEADMRLAADRMAADSYFSGYEDGIACFARYGAQTCRERLTYSSIPGHPNDPGFIPDRTRRPFNKAARRASKQLYDVLCGDSEFTYIPPPGLPASLTLREGEWVEKTAWLLKSGCKNISSAVGSRLGGGLGPGSHPWDWLSFEIEAQDRGIPRYMWISPEARIADY